MKQFFLYALLSLTGCSHLVQRNMFPSSRRLPLSSSCQPHHSGSHALDRNGQPSAFLLNYCVASAQILNHYEHIFELPVPAVAYVMTPVRAGGDATMVVRGIEDAADNAMLSLDSLVKTVAYVLDPKPNNINLHTVIDINDRAAKVGLTLTPEFNSLCFTLRTASAWTPEAVDKLSIAYAICAFCSAYYVHATLMNIMPDTAHRIYTTVNKAFIAATTAVIATYLTAIFINERRTDVASVLANTQSLHSFMKLAVWAGVELSPAVINTVIFIAYATADRTIRAASAATTLPVADPLDMMQIRTVLATIAAAFPSTGIATGLYNDLRVVPTYALDLPLAQAALAAYFARAFS